MCRYLSLCLLTALGGLVPDVALLDPVAIPCLIFLGPTKLFLQQRHRCRFPPAVRARSGFSRAEVGPFPVSVSQRRSGEQGVTCAHTAHVQTGIRARRSDALPLEMLMQTRGGAGARRWGSGHGRGSNPGRLPSQLMLLNVLALISVFFPAFLNLCCKMFSYLNCLSGCGQYV